MFCTHLNYKLNWSVSFSFNCACVVKSLAGQTVPPWHSLACAVKTEGKTVRVCVGLRSGDGEPPDHYETTYSVFSYSTFLQIADKNAHTSHVMKLATQTRIALQSLIRSSDDIFTLMRFYYMLHLVSYFPWRKDGLFVRKCQYITTNIQTAWSLKMDR